MLRIKLKNALSACRDEELRARERYDAGHLAATGRMLTHQTPWSYRDVALPYVRKSKALLDIATKGGGLLAGFAPLPFHAHATQADPSLLDAARLRLSPLGVNVHPVRHERDLPLRDHYFDLALCYNAGFIPEEVARVVRQGGIFITQQISGDDGIELNQHLELRRPASRLTWNLASAADALREAGFCIVDAQECSLERQFLDIGAVTYFVAHLPLSYPGFSVDRCQRALCTLDRYIKTRGGVSTRKTRFLLVARRV